MKIIIFLLTGALCLSMTVYGQSISDTIPSFIGKECPNFKIKNILNYKSESAQISDFRGRWLILDFWATWCGGCVRDLPTEDSIQRIYGKKLQILGVNDQTREIIQKFLDKREKSTGVKLQLPTVSSDTTIRDYFQTVYLPHVVWVNPEGIITYITSGTDLSFKHVQKLFSGQILVMNEKKDALPTEISIGIGRCSWR